MVRDTRPARLRVNKCSNCRSTSGHTSKCAKRARQVCLRPRTKSLLASSWCYRGARRMATNSPESPLRVILYGRPARRSPAKTIVVTHVGVQTVVLVRANALGKRCGRATARTHSLLCRCGAPGTREPGFKAFPMIPNGCHVSCHKFCHRAACNRVGPFSRRLRSTELPEVNLCHPVASLAIDRLCSCGQFRVSVTDLESDCCGGWWKAANQANIERYLRLEQP